MELMNLVYAVELGEKKYTWEEAVKYYIQKKETETPKMQFFYKGKKYKSVSACCAEYGVNASSVRNRAKTTNAALKNLWNIS